MSTTNVFNTLSVKTTHYVLGGVALVAAISWNNTIREFISKCIPTPEDQVHANIIYSLAITIVLVMMIILLPDTHSELPKTIQEKINDEHEKELLYEKLHELQTEIKNLKKS